jgi:predicted TPR repeat methyltransferase
MKADSISKALRDAEKCVELAPQWSKGYSRLGAAQHGLKRFQAAIETYRKGEPTS